MIVNIINGIISSFSYVVNAVLLLLPNSPFSFSLTSSFSTYVAYLNWFIPVNLIVNTFVLYLSAALVWYAVRWVLRFSRYIE